MRRYAASVPDDEGESVADGKRSSRFNLSTGQAVIAGALDSIPWVDEIGAHIDSFIYGVDYDERLQENRDFLADARANHYAAFLVGEVAGGFIPGAGIAGKGVKGAMLGGAAYGALYGSGAADGGVEDRLRGALTGAGAGALGGYLLEGVIAPSARWAGGRVAGFLKRGRTIELNPAELPQRPLETPRWLADEPSPELTPHATVEVERAAAHADGGSGAGEFDTLLTVRDMLGEPAAAAKAVSARVGRLTPIEAERVLRDIQRAEADGTVVANPHFRSLLNLDLSDTPLTTAQVARAASTFEDAVEALAVKAGSTRRTMASMDHEVAEELQKGITLDELGAQFQQSQKAFVGTRVAQHVMLTAAAKVVRVREEYLPKLIAGQAGAREAVASQLTDAAHRLVYAQGIISNAGRSLGILSHGVKAKMVDVSEDAAGLSVAEVSSRVQSALATLGDRDLAELLARVRTVNDAEKISRVLLDPPEAEAFSTWQRAVNSASLMLRSNGLTPATFAWNALANTFHIYLRGALSRRFAAASLEEAGRLPEAIALRAEDRLVKAAHWQATTVALKAALDRVRWEFWTDVERIAAVGWGSGGAVAKARLKRGTMLSEGYSPPAVREFGDRPRLAISDPAEFNAQNDTRRDAGCALANIVYHMEKARAVAANTVDALGGASMKLFSAAPDDMGREYVRVTHGLAISARYAFREAQAIGIPADQLADYIGRRGRELAETPTAEMMQAIESAMVSSDGGLSGEAAFFRTFHEEIEREADTALFMDGPQSAAGRKMAEVLELDRLGLVFPYVRTPLRLFEHGLVNYGPFASHSQEVQGILAGGGVAAELERARIAIGSRVFNWGLGLGLAGAITASNGGYTNSANLDQGAPNRLNFPGGGYIEIGRFDPFSLTVALGAIVGQAFRDGYHAGTDYEQEEVLRTALSTAYFGAREAILDKSYLKGLQDILNIVDGNGPQQGLAQVESVLQNSLARAVPLAGVGRQINETFRSSAIESVGTIDTLLRSVPGGGYGMSPRIDPLGDEVKGRTLGINLGSSELTEGSPISATKRRLRELGIDLSTIRASDPAGFDLTSDELSEVRRIRGREALNGEGLTMHEALTELLDDPHFNALRTKGQKRELIMQTMREFNGPAWELLAERDPSFASKRTYTHSLADYIAEGMTRNAARREALADVGAEGLPKPEL